MANQIYRAKHGAFSLEHKKLQQAYFDQDNGIRIYYWTENRNEFVMVLEHTNSQKGKLTVKPIANHQVPNGLVRFLNNEFYREYKLLQWNN